MRPRRPLGSLATLTAVSVLLAGCTSSGGRPAPTSGRGAPSSTGSAPTRTATSPPAGSASSSTGNGPATARLGRRSGLAVPDRAATPGAALPGVTRAQVCTRNWNPTHNKIGFAVQNAVSNRYAVVAGPGTSLHLDQLIPASLGGSATQPNVWPQPEAQFMKKNAVEARLHQLVCAGELSLATAQNAMAQDWPAAQRKYPPA